MSSSIMNNLMLKTQLLSLKKQILTLIFLSVKINKIFFPFNKPPLHSDLEFS